MIIFLVGFFMPREIDEAVIAAFSAIWMLATIVCLIRGIYIFRSHQRLAWCCFLVVLLQILLAIVPVFFAPKRISHMGESRPNKGAAGNSHRPFSFDEDMKFEYHHCSQAQSPVTVPELGR
jgi:hypothetical protein